jgi:AraC-like DNA-binding protein
MKDSSLLLRLVHESMVGLNVDVNTIYKKMGVRSSHIEDTKSRLKHNVTDRFWAIAEELTGDRDIGLKVARNLPPYKGQVLEYLFLSSPTFGDGLRRALNYQRLLSDVAQSYLTVQGDDAQLVLNTKMGSRVNRHFVQCITRGIIEFFESVTNGQFKTTRMDFVFDDSDDNGEYQKTFNTPKIYFNQAENAIHFNASVLDQKSIHAEPELLKLHEKVAGEHVARLEQEDLIQDVRKIIGELLETQEVSLDMVAQHLELSPRNLRTALAAADTNFNQILSDYRSLLAKRLLVQTNESVEEIVYLTGFSEPSTFYRAFKRWTGQTPIEYRKQRKGSRI